MLMGLNAKYAICIFVLHIIAKKNKQKLAKCTEREQKQISEIFEK